MVRMNLVNVVLSGMLISYGGEISSSVPEAARGNGQESPNSTGNLLQHAPSQKPEQSDAPLPATTEKVQTQNDENLRDSYFQCLNSAAGVTPQIEDCIDEELAFQDERLNDILQRMIDGADKQGQSALKTVQEEWLIDRDQSCSSDGQGGQGARLETNGCVLERTAKRATELEARSRAL